MDCDLEVFVINRYPPFTSPHRYANEVKSALGNCGHVLNLIFDSAGWDRPHEGPDFKVNASVYSSIPRLIGNTVVPALTQYVSKLLDDEKDIIVHYANQFSGIVGGLPGQRVISVMDSPYDPTIKALTTRIYINRLFSRLSRERNIITQTKHLAGDLEEFGFNTDIEVIPLPYSPSFTPVGNEKSSIQKDLGLPSDKILVLSVSTNDPRKNIPAIANAMKLLGENYKLVRVGSPIGDSLNFSGVDDRTLNALYNACDLLLFPSLYEGFGLPIVEAFAAGLPVVTSRIPTIEEVSGNAAVLVEPHSVTDIVDGVKLAVSEGETLKRRGLKRAEEFTFEKFRQRLLRYYGKLGLMI